MAFANAKVLKTATASKKKCEVQISMPGLKELAALDTMIKALTTLKETVEMDVKTAACVHFVKIGIEKKGRPENYNAIETFTNNGEDFDATASIQLRKRSEVSALSDDEVQILTENNLPYNETSKIANTYVINPKYFNNQEILTKVEDALKGVEGLPEDFIMEQEGVTKRVVDETALDEVFKLSQEKVLEILPILTTLAVKPKFNADMKIALEVVEELMAI